MRAVRKTKSMSGPESPQPGSMRPLYDTMQAIWEMLFTGLGVVMIAATVAVIAGLCVVVWFTRKID
jgi:hypothetical protein